MASYIAHLLCPGAFESVNRMAFEDRIRAHVLINGSIEAGLGVALLNSRTRRAALAAVREQSFLRTPKDTLGQLESTSQAENLHFCGSARSSAASPQ